MTNSAFELELTRQSHAALRPEDLEMMGKRASQLYLEQGVPLNRAVVKIASECHGISTEQVKRVVEFANLSTNARLFEKQAGDKNVEFVIADPSEVLRTINESARGPVVKVAAAEYFKPPVGVTRRNLEADLQLLEIFGLEPEKTAAMKTAAGMMDPSMQAQSIVAGEPQALPAPAAPPGAESPLVADNPMAGKDMSDPTSFMEQMPPSDKALNKGMDYANASMDQAKQFRDPEAFMKVLDAVKVTAKVMFPEAEQRKAVQKQMSQLPQGIDPNTMEQAQGGAAAGGMAPAGGMKMASYDQFSDFMTIPDQAMGLPSIPAIQAFQPLPPFGMGQQQMGGLQQFGLPPSFLGQDPNAAPQDPDMGGDMFPKMSSAMSYVNSRKPGSDKVRADLESYTSLDNIKQAAAQRGQYPLSNPNGDLLRIKQVMDKEAGNYTEAFERSEIMTKQALSEFNHHVRQHVLGGGNLGEVTHAISGIGDEDHLKEAMAGLMPELARSNINLVKLQADLIHYEMEKASSARSINPENEIVQSYNAFVQAKETTTQFQKLAEEAHELRNEAVKLLGRAMTRG
jgi:hypothetical protein